MSPIDKAKGNCEIISSNCVEYQGVDLLSFSLCRGASISEVIAALDKNLYGIQSELDITNYDLTQFNVGRCTVTDTQSLIQFILDSVSQLEDAVELYDGTKDSSVGYISITQSCSSLDMANKKVRIDTAINSIIERICSLSNSESSFAKTIETYAKNVASLAEQVNNLANNFEEPYDKISNENIESGTPLSVDAFASAMATSVFAFIEKVGKDPIITQGNIFNWNLFNQSETPLSDNNTDYSSLGLISTASTLSEVVKNQAVVIKDLRDYIKDIKTNYIDKMPVMFELESTANGDTQIDFKLSYEFFSATMNSIVVTAKVDSTSTVYSGTITPETTLSISGLSSIAGATNVNVIAIATYTKNSVQKTITRTIKIK